MPFHGPGKELFFDIHICIIIYIYSNHEERRENYYGAFTSGSKSLVLIASVTGVLDGCVGSLKCTKFDLYG